MPWLIGIDEAGYGPNLGPMVQTSVPLCVPDGDADLWDTWPRPFAGQRPRRRPAADRRFQESQRRIARLSPARTRRAGRVGRGTRAAFFAWRYSQELRHRREPVRFARRGLVRRNAGLAGDGEVGSNSRFQQIVASRLRTRTQFRFGAVPGVVTPRHGSTPFSTNGETKRESWLPASSHCCKSIERCRATNRSSISSISWEAGTSTPP